MPTQHSARPVRPGADQRACAWLELTTGPFGVRVTSAGEGGDGYAVGLVTTRLPTGGGRWWFACLGCGRRCDLLYLLPGAGRLTCRRCGGLAYRYQQVRQPKSARKRRTRSTVTVARRKHEYFWGHIHVVERTLTLTDRSGQEHLTNPPQALRSTLNSAPT